MQQTPNLAEIEKRVAALEKALKTSLKREETLARRLVGLEKQLKTLKDAHGSLRSHVSQTAPRTLKAT